MEKTLCPSQPSQDRTISGKRHFTPAILIAGGTREWPPRTPTLKLSRLLQVAVLRLEGHGSDQGNKRSKCEILLSMVLLLKR
ncbi:hypothetical protein V1264_017510 [Littorina saxatilis]|uniref:Uncharacterized protein n=1 Tax=Littorina saxatilis TaxID=31220 RepID=A0AAN9GFU7_9CAEN